MLLTVNKLNKETITGIVGNEKYTIPYNEDTYKALQDLETAFDNAATIEEASAIIVSATALTVVTTETVIASKCPSLKYDTKTGKFYLTQNGKVSTIPLPQVLATRIIESVEKEIPFEPLVKAWIWFLRNPQFSLNKAALFAQYLVTTVVDDKESADLQKEKGYSKEKADELATYNDVSITKNGLLVTYKYAQIKYKKYGEDGKPIDRYHITYDEETGAATVHLPENAEDFYLIPPIKGEGGDSFYANEDLGHRIKVGAIHRLPDWSYVDTNDSHSCVKGLHLGGLRYINGYGGHDRLLLNCFVNPMHIGAFDNAGHGAIRVLEYFVHSAQFAPNKQLYSESNYLAQTEAQWADMRGEAIKKSEEAIAKLKDFQDQINAF